jgi:type IV pilus assembly protein PilV
MLNYVDHLKSGTSLRNYSKNARGFSMIEVLVSIVISAIGLLALAGVNAASVRYTKMSQYRSTATQLANDMGERMRANKGQDLVAVPPSVATGFFAGDYDFVTDFAGQATVATLPGVLCDTAASNCTPAQIAALDLAQWRILVRDQLPEGSVFLQRQAGQVAMNLWVVWRDPAVGDADEAPEGNQECPNGLSRGADLSIRCSYFRINL